MRRLLPICSSVRGRHRCRVKIGGFLIEAVRGWQEADEEGLSRELGTAGFKREACETRRRSPGEGEKWE